MSGDTFTEKSIGVSEVPFKLLTDRHCDALIVLGQTRRREDIASLIVIDPRAIDELISMKCIEDEHGLLRLTPAGQRQRAILLAHATQLTIPARHGRPRSREGVREGILRSAA